VSGTDKSASIDRVDGGFGGGVLDSNEYSTRAVLVVLLAVVVVVVVAESSSVVRTRFVCSSLFLL